MKAKSPLTLVVDNDKVNNPVRLYIAREAAITVEPAGGTIRVLSEAPSPENDHPPYSAACTYTRLSSTEIMMSGFAGEGINRTHLALIVQWALSEGYEWLYADRVSRRVIPMGRKRTERPLLGWWELNLLEAKQAAKRAVERAPRKERA